nr:MAG: hypothetical protein [Bacteriophage sp.]
MALNPSSAPVTASRRFKTVSVPFKKVLNAATERLSVKSRALLRSIPSLFNFLSPFTRSSRLSTGPPRASASLPLLSARLSKILRVAVAADEASKPLFAKAPKRAVVSSIVNPKEFATGPTIDIAVFKYSKLKADALHPIVIVETARSVSSASRLKIRNVAPPSVAAEARSASTALANFNTEGVIALISSLKNPSLASSI